MKYNDNGTVKEIKVKAFDTLPVGTEVDYDGATVPEGWTEVEEYDSGWQNLTLTSNFNNWGGDNDLKYRKVGKVVHIVGAITPTSEIAANLTTTISTLPSGDRPRYEIYAMQHGSGMNNWLLKIQANGTIAIERYGTTSNIAIPTGAWLPIQATFLVD